MEKNFILFLLLAVLSGTSPTLGAQTRCKTLDIVAAPSQDDWRAHLERLRQFVLQVRHGVSDVRTVRVGQKEYRVVAYLGGGNEGRVFEVEDDADPSGHSIVKKFYPPPDGNLFREAYMVWSLGRILAAQVSGIPTTLPNVDGLTLKNLPDRFPFIERDGNKIHAVPIQKLSNSDLEKMPNIDLKNMTAKFVNHYAISVEDALSDEIYNGKGDEKIPIPKEYRVPENIRKQIAAAYNEWKRKHLDGRFNPSAFNEGDHGTFVGRSADVLIELAPPHRMYLGDD